MKVSKFIESLPNNIEAEKVLLGTMLTDNPLAVINVTSALELEDFYEGNRANYLVYRSIISLQNKKAPVDIQTVAEELNNMKELENVGGVDFLVNLVESSISFSNLDYYIKIVKDQAVLRNFLLVVREIERKYREEDIEDIPDFIGNCEESITKITQTRRVSDFITAKELANRVELSVQTIKDANEENVTGVSTGFARLNLLTHGFQPGELSIVAARPSVGKTALAINFAFNAYLRSNVSVAFFSLEMSADLIASRLVASRSFVPLNNLTTGRLSNKEKASLTQGLNEVANAKLYIDDTPGIKLSDILAKARKLKAAHEDLKLIVVDYIGLITTGKREESRQLEVSHISHALKDLARELKVHVLAVSQVSRKVDDRESQKPLLSDLRESGSIEQDADVVMLLYRSSYYDDTKGAATSKKTFGRMSPNEQMEAAKQTQAKDNKLTFGEGVFPVEVNVAKNRNGQTGKCTLLFYMKYGRFDTPSPEHEEMFNRLSNDDSDE